MLNSSNAIINKTWYDGSGVAKINTTPTVASPVWPAKISSSAAKYVIKNGILNPDTYCANNYMDYFYYNLWSANNTTSLANDNAVVKTVYDPSPAGYHLPALNAFTGFSTASPSAWDATSKSWTFSKDGNTVNFPAAGYRFNSSSAVERVGVNGHYWLALPYNRGYGNGMGFSSSRVYTLYEYYRSDGFSVRPVAE